MGLFSIIKFKVILLTFTKFEEFLKCSTVKAGLSVVFIFQPEDMFRLCLNFNEIQPTLGSFNKHNAYKHTAWNQEYI